MKIGFWETAESCLNDRGGPAHLQIESWLMKGLERGDLAEGDRFPNERVLAASLGVSRMTLRQALSTLEAKGCIIKKRGADGGTFISRPELEVDLTDVGGLSAQIQRARRIAGATVLESRTIAADTEVANELLVEEGASVYRIVRVRLADGLPVVIERSYFPAAPFPLLLDKTLDGSLYAVLGGYGAAPTNAVEFLQASLASEEDAELLQIHPQTAVMLVRRVATDANQRPVEFSQDVYRSDRMKLTVRSTLKAAADD